MITRSVRGLVAVLNRAHLAVVPARTRRPCRRQGTVRPQLEILDSRILPSVDIWTGADVGNGNYNWSDPNNWSLGRIPGASDVAQLGPDGNPGNKCIIDQNFTLGGLQILGSWWGGAAIVGNAGVTVTLNGTNASEWDSGTLSVDSGFNLVNNGTLTLNGSEGFSGGGGTITNNGTINLGGTGLVVYGSGAAPTLDNIGTLDFTNDAGIYFGGNSNGGLVLNTGLIEKTGGSATSDIFNGYGNLENNGGTIDVASGTIGIGCNSDNTNGTYNVAAGAKLDLTNSSGFTFTESGTFTGQGAGKILLAGGTLATGSGTTTFNIPDTLTFLWSGGEIDPGGSQNGAGDTLVYNGTLTIDNANDVAMRGGGTFQNDGTILQEGAGNVILVGNSGGGSANVIDNAGTYNFSADGSIYAGNVGEINNTGTIEKTGSAGGISNLFSGYGTLINTGILDVAAGTLAVAPGTSTFTGGTYDVALNAFLDLGNGSGNIGTSGTITQSGTFTGQGAGTIVLDNATLMPGSTNATFVVPSTLAFQWSNGIIDVPSGETLAWNGNLTLINGQTVYMTGGGTFQENGTLTQQGAGSLVFPNSNTTTTIVIPNGSVYDFASNAGISGFGNGALTNAGTIEKTAGGGASLIQVGFSNAGGTLSVSAGNTLVLGDGGTSTGGVFNVATGGVLDLTGGSTMSYSGTYTGSGGGQVLLDSGTLNVTGGSSGATFNLPGGLFVWTGGDINIAPGSSFTVVGKMNITGATTEYLTGGGTLNVGTTSTGTINDISTGNTLNLQNNSTLAIGAHGTFNIADDTINGSGAITNLGNLTKSAGTSGATISTLVDNQKSVTVDAGTLTLSGPVDQVFNNTDLTGGSWTVVGSKAKSVLNITSASFTTIDPGVKVVLNGPYASFTNLSSVTTNDGSLSLLGGASLTTAGSFTNGGTLILTPSTTANSVLTVNGAFTQTSTGALDIGLSGTVSAPTFGAINSTGAVTLAGTLKVTGSVKVPAVGSSLDLLDNMSGSPISGGFSGLPEGSTFTVNGMTFKITYAGGSSGHDVVITRTA